MKRKTIDLNFLLNADDYVLDLDKMHMLKERECDIDMYFYGSYNPTNLLIDDPSRDYFLISFQNHAVFLGTFEEYGIDEEELGNTRPMVKIESPSIFHNFSNKELKVNAFPDRRGTLTQYVIRTFEQEFHILSYTDPVVIDYTDYRNP